MDVLLITSSSLVVITNVCVCCMVIGIKRLRTFTNYFVASLALSDILIGGVLLPMHLPGRPVHPVAGYMISIIMVSGVANVCAVTWDRYLAVMSPFDYNDRLRRSYRQVLVVTWIFAIAYSLLPLIWNNNISSIYHKCFLVFSMAACVLMPYILIIVAYVKIFKRLRTHMSQLKRFNVSRKKRDGARRASIEGKTVNVFLLVVAVFILSWSPVIYMTLTEYVAGRPDLIPTPLPFVSLVILAISSMVNPFLYAFMKRDFTRELLRMILGRKPLSQSLSSTTNTSSQGSMRRYFCSLGRTLSYRNSQKPRLRRATVSGGETRKKTSTSIAPLLKRHFSEPKNLARKFDRENENLKESQSTATLNRTGAISRDAYKRDDVIRNKTARNAFENVFEGGRRAKDVGQYVVSNGSTNKTQTRVEITHGNHGYTERAISSEQ